MGKNRNICNDCKQRDKCIKCKLHIPKHPFKMCNFCKFNQKPINDGKQILGRYCKIPIYILYDPYGPYFEHSTSHEAAAHNLRPHRPTSRRGCTRVTSHPTLQNI